MVDPARLETLLDHIATELAVLADLRERGDHDLLDDPTAIRAVKYAFVVAIEAAIDTAEHIIASEGLRAAESFADAFAVLEEAGLLDTELAASLGDAARFRNLLVHNYADVDDRRVVAILRSRLDDLHSFRRVVAGLVDSGPGNPGT